MSLVSSTRARRLSRRAAMLLAVLVAGVAVLSLTGESEARGAPSWLSRFVRAVAGRNEGRSVAVLATDTIVVFGPKTLSLGAATSGTFVEQFAVATPTSGGYLLRVTNGPAGAARMTAAR